MGHGSSGCAAVVGSRRAEEAGPSQIPRVQSTGNGVLKAFDRLGSAVLVIEKRRAPQLYLDITLWIANLALQSSASAV